MKFCSSCASLGSQHGVGYFADMRPCCFHNFFVPFLLFCQCIKNDFLRILFLGTRNHRSYTKLEVEAKVRNVLELLMMGRKVVIFRTWPKIRSAAYAHPQLLNLTNLSRFLFIG